MNGGGLVLQWHRYKVATAHDPVDPGAPVHSIEDGIVNIKLLLKIQVDRIDIGVRAIERCPIQAASASVWNTSGCRICGGWIGEPNDHWFVDLSLHWKNVVIEQASHLGC